MENDGRLLNIDPVSLFQYVLPSVLSLMGRETGLDVGNFVAPNIGWFVVVQPSGGGKTRAKKVATAYLDGLQQSATKTYLDELQKWKEAQRSRKKGDPVVSLPKHKKYIFNQSTPQAVLKLLADQESSGCLFSRDEVKGLFTSLDQFAKDGDGKETLLETWDGTPVSVDRVKGEDSYYVPTSRLSVVGGLQPGIFKTVFKDPDDAQGMLARCLLALPRQLPTKRTVGYCELSGILPDLYTWVNTTGLWGILKLTPDADDLFTELYEEFGNEANKEGVNAATRAWLSKLSGQTLRLALGLHAIECYYDKGKNNRSVTRDTLSRAFLLAHYYKACFYVIQNLMGSETDMSSVMASVLRKAQSVENPEQGLAMRDIYTSMRAFRNLAKETGKGVSEVTLQICRQLEALGKGKVFQVDEVFYFTALKSDI